MGTFNSKLVKRALSKVRKQAGLPPVPQDLPVEHQAFFGSIRENLAVRMGQEGDPLEKAVTFRDMGGVGMLGGGGSGGGFSLVPPNTDDPLDYSPPPAITNLAANGGFDIIFLTWDSLVLSYNYYVEVWRSPVDALDLAGPDIKLIGTAKSPLYVDNLNGDRTIYYYWVRIVKAIGSQLIYGPFNQTAGTPGQITLDPAYVIESLQGRLAKSELAAELLTPINAIPTIQTTLDDHGIRIPTVEGIVSQHQIDIPNLQTRLGTAEGDIVTAETDITNLQASVTSAELDIVANADATTALDSRVTINETEISTQAGQITSLQSSLNGLTVLVFDPAYNYAIGDLFSYSNVVYQVIATQTQPNVMPPNATYYEAKPDYTSLGDTVTANSAAVSSLDTRVTSAEGTITAHGADITLLQTDVTTAQGNISGNTTALSALDTRVTTAEGTITAHSTDITTLQTDVTAAQSDATANASAVSALDTRVTTAEGSITSNSSDITALENTVNDPLTGVAANAAAATFLDSRVTVNEGDISSVGTSLTTLTGRVTTAEGDITGNANALTLLDGRVTITESSITSQGSAITQLENTVNDPLTGVSASASAIDSLDTRVTSAEGALTSQATDIDGLQVTVGNNSAAIQTKAEASVVTALDGEVTSIKAQWTIKTDVNGNLAGIGLMNDGVTSEFIVASEAVYFIDQSQSIEAFSPATNYPSIDAVRDTQLVFGYAEVEGFKRFVINVPAYIPDASITTAQISNATITQAQIVDLSVAAADITAANIWEYAGIGGVIQSIPFTSGTQGWRLTQGGNLEANNATVRGHIEATSGFISDNLQIGGTSYNIGEVAQLANDGTRVLFTKTFNQYFPGNSTSDTFSSGGSGKVTIEVQSDLDFSAPSSVTLNAVTATKVASRDTATRRVEYYEAENLVVGTNTVRVTAPSSGSYLFELAIIKDAVGIVGKANTAAGWVRPGSTLIDGNKIFTGDVYVDTAVIAGQAVTFPRGGYTAGSVGVGSGYATVQSYSFAGTGAPLIIGATCAADFEGLQGGRAEIRLLVNGFAVIENQSIGTAAQIGSTSGGNNVEAIYGFKTTGSVTFYYEFPPSGTVTIAVQVRGVNVSGSVANRSLWSMEAKR